MKDVLKLNIQHVRGYRGASAVFLAQQRGEVDGQVIGIASIKVGQPALWKAGALRPLIAFGRTTRFAELPDVPTGRELTNDPKVLRLLDFAESPLFMALPLISPPDLPPERAKALRRGLHGDDARPRLHRGGRQDAAGAQPDRRRSRAQGSRADAIELRPT